MPILWMGDKNHSLCKYIAKKYADVVVWNDISSYDSRRNLDRISGMGTLVISHPLPARQKKFVSFAMTKGIAVIIVVKNKNAHAVGKAYGAHCFICQTDNRADYGCSLLSRLIEEHGKRIKS